MTATGPITTASTTARVDLKAEGGRAVTGNEDSNLVVPFLSPSLHLLVQSTLYSDFSQPRKLLSSRMRLAGHERYQLLRERSTNSSDTE